jgi:hypothetical protein
MNTAQFITIFFSDGLNAEDQWQTLDAAWELSDWDWNA